MSVYVHDLEVLRGPDEVDGGWENPEAMGFGTAVVWSEASDLYDFFGPEDKQELINLLTDGRVVSFNGIKFDNRVLLGNDYNQGSAWTDYDILLEVIKSKFGLNSVAEAEQKLGEAEVHDGSLGLNAISQATLGLGKTGKGADAPELIRKAKWSEVFAYNLNDTRLTTKLLHFIRDYGYVVDGNGKRIEIITVPW